MTRYEELTPAQRKRVNAAAREVTKAMGKKAPPAAPAKKKGHPVLGTLLRVVLGLGAIYVFFAYVMPSKWFDVPRNQVAVVGALLTAVLVVAVLVVMGKAKSDAAMVVAVVIAAAAGVALYTQDAGSAMVRAGIVDCQPVPKGKTVAKSPNGTECVMVPKCPRGKVPGWQADRETPTGTCVARRAAR